MLRAKPASTASAAGVFSFGDLNEADLVAILRDLRPHDRREIEAVLPRVVPIDNFTIQARMLIAGSIVGGIFHDPATSLPAAAIGLVENWPGVWEGWSFGTEGYRACQPQMAEWCRHIAMPAIAGAKVHRVHVKSLGDYSAAHTWIEWLGLEREAAHPGFGRAGEDFVTFAWVHPDLAAQGDR